mgnify:CR=1 FL=1
MSIRQSPKTKLFSLLLATAVLSACGGGGSSSTAAAPVQPVYTAIFDAGSSGTRLSFYKVIPSQGGYPIIEKIATYDKDLDKVTDDDGINDFLNGNGEIVLSAGDEQPVGCPGTPVANGKYRTIKGLQRNDVEPCVLQPLLQQLDSGIANLNAKDPSLKLTKSQVKVELFATAGMRTEDVRNGGSNTTAQIEQYYGEMKAYTTTWGYDAGAFKTINGNSEEGVWTWINLNDYYYNAFGGNPTKSATIQSPVGDFEVGGSSMQIAFPTNLSPSDRDNVYQVSINGKTFNVYSKTFLGLGGDDARKFVRAFNYNTQDGGLNCYASTAEVSNTKEGSGVQLYPSNQVISGAYPFPANINLNTPWTTLAASAFNLTTSPNVGGYDFSGCSSKYSTIIDQVISLQRNKYGTLNEGDIATIGSFKTKLQSSTAQFVGLDNFYYSANDLNYKPSTGFVASEFKTKLLSYCAGQVADKKNLQNVCPNGTFMYDFLFGANGLFNGGTATFAGVQSTKENGDTVLTWTRGYLLQKYSK